MADVDFGSPRYWVSLRNAHARRRIGFEIGSSNRLRQCYGSALVPFDNVIALRQLRAIIPVPREHGVSSIRRNFMISPLRRLALSSRLALAAAFPISQSALANVDHDPKIAAVVKSFTDRLDEELDIEIGTTQPPR
jgi:hypothetical protein